MSDSVSPRPRPPRCCKRQRQRMAMARMTRIVMGPNVSFREHKERLVSEGRGATVTSVSRHTQPQ